MGEHDNSPFDHLADAYDAAIELVEDHCDILLGIYEDQGLDIEVHGKTGEYLETRRVIRELRAQIDLDRERPRR